MKLNIFGTPNTFFSLHFVSFQILIANLNPVFQSLEFK